MNTQKAFRILAPLFLSALSAGALLLLIKPYVQYEGIFEDLAIWGIFFSVFGIVYAIVAGFLLVTVLTKYSDLSQTIENELNAIETVRDFLTYLEDIPAETKRNTLVALSNYSASILDKEWGEMSSAVEPMDSDTSEELYEIMRKSKRMTPHSETDNIVFTSIIENISDITKLRTKRIALANDRLPPRLRLLMTFMSIVIITAFMLLGVKSIYTHLAIIISLTVSIHLLYMIIEDLDHPFFGIWNINKRPLDELVTRFKKDISK